jgi:chromosome segregation ATPase
MPAYATATIPLAIQTTRYAVAGAEFGALGNAVGVRRDTELSRSAIEEAVREALRQENAVQRESAPAKDSCAELKTRIESVEKRLDQIEKQVQSIAGKLDQLKK